jgi:hydroxymethylpyrimidine pyrophosphatase-like HAD family hydrolase
METQITAIFSDYDGTLCSTDSVRSQGNRIPEELEHTLWDISQRIPLCIISSKDYHFLHPRTKFARILSCIMGIETLTFKICKKEGWTTSENIKTGSIRKERCGDTSSCIEDSHLMLDDNKTLQANSSLLSRLADNVSLGYKDVIVERKFTSNKQILAGVTFDYRHLENWRLYKEKLEPYLKEMMQKSQLSPAIAGTNKLYLQTYALHPFIDVYGTNCDKGMAFDYVASKISTIEGKCKRPQKIMYLGDSDNDNPAFIKADVPVGIRSDDRLNPKLFCAKVVKFDALSKFLKKLMDNNFVYSDYIIHSI